MSKNLKQLKKSDFLNVITDGPMTRGQVVEALEDFEFVASYLDYLTDHFVAQGKVIKHEDGTFNRKPRKGSAPKDVFRVMSGGDGPVMETKEVTGGLSDEDKAESWSITKGAAIKKASSVVFAFYKSETAKIKKLAHAHEPSDDEIESDDKKVESGEKDSESSCLDDMAYGL